MSVREREFIPDRIYFITYTIYKWIQLFTEEKYFYTVYKWFDYKKKHYNNKIHGYVIMPNHIHLLLYISDHSYKILQIFPLLLLFQKSLLEKFYSIKNKNCSFSELPTSI